MRTRSVKSAAAGFLTLVVVEDGLSHTHRFRRHLHQLVFLDIFQTFLQGHDDLRDDTGLLV